MEFPAPLGPGRAWGVPPSRPRMPNGVGDGKFRIGHGLRGFGNCVAPPQDGPGAAGIARRCYAALRRRAGDALRGFFRDEPRAPFSPLRLWRSASIKSMTLLSCGFSSGTSMVLPLALRRTRALRAFSYSSLKRDG